MNEVIERYNGIVNSAERETKVTAQLYRARIGGDGHLKLIEHGEPVELHNFMGRIDVGRHVIASHLKDPETGQTGWFVTSVEL